MATPTYFKRGLAIAAMMASLAPAMAPLQSAAAPFSLNALKHVEFIGANSTSSEETTKAQFIEDANGSERINFAGKLRMLTQRIASYSCAVASGVDTENSLLVLQAATGEYSKIINGLEFGDADLNINSAETKRKITHKINEKLEAWIPFHDAVQKLIKDQNDAKAITYISENNMDLLQHAKDLVVVISATYSNPSEMLQSDAMLIDIAGRQRMLSQKMGKEICAVVSGNTALGTSDVFQQTMNTFETSLLALRDGLAAAGISAPPTPEINEQIQLIWSDWEVVKQDLAALTESSFKSLEAEAAALNQLDTILVDMNRAVGMYTQNAKLGL